MKPRINFITLGVADLDRALAFYRDGLKLPTDGIIGAEFGESARVVFFRMDGGLILALWPRKEIAREGGVVNGAPNAAEMTIAHNVGSKEEVDAVIAEAGAAGATIPTPAADRVWGGYTGYFQDPDGHLWEVAWNPDFKLE